VEEDQGRIIMKFGDYRNRRNWKIALLLGAIVIGVSSLFYTNNLVKQLSLEELKRIELWAEAYNQVLYSEDEDITFAMEVIKNNETIPVILTDENKNIIAARNLDSTLIEDEEYVKEQKKIMQAQHDPIVVEYAEGKKNYIYYKNSYLVTQLRYYPMIQIFIISLFLMVSYFAFNSSRKYEQNKVWVGMSKETAHQLGTPLSSLMAWVEYLKENSNGGVSNTYIKELEKDIKRLEVITERFSKIGSAPVLVPENVYDIIHDSIEYLKVRVPKKVIFTIDKKSDRDATVPMSKSLFDWVIENLSKNAVNAMDGEGNIRFKITEKEKEVIIDIADSGKGISKSDFKTIFNPGYTTRKRGWGLGLSLAKRIINEYHGGQIYVKDSEIGKGTTFRIRLNKVTELAS
jgi:hypothetical protein